MRKIAVTVFSVIGLSACTSVTPQMEAIQTVGSQQAVQGCKFVKSVRGDHIWVAGPVAYDDAINQMKKKAAEAGANRLYIVNINTGPHGANAMADAYKC